ncbi:serine/threonine-protein kinase [Actinomadura parmotrematis]|uniref:non-specific serine/threonine protein kinase n=1 Tax=Actinomadura parmotrematis TaxID=2864039 RepID=A0ABS7FZ64_9ACTN|nr:serine/threonine-protein kinase [Actinomadura parmotrematis]MBW8485561.1 serine/threonine protein kinase [Actinomadura parmotrematis]
MTIIADRYELDRYKLGPGGMGMVYGALDRVLARRVAVKLLRPPAGPDAETAVKRFRREARAVAGLNHPGVPALYDIGRQDGGEFADCPYLVMELVGGAPLSTLLDEHGRLPVGWAAALTAQACAVLDHAHGSGLVHRDLKPQNMMVTPDGALRVLDFGLAAIVAGDDSGRLTGTGQYPGTLAYIAPERFDAGCEPDPACDLYALGVILYEALSGANPFAANDIPAVIRAQLERVPPAIEDVPGELDRLARALLEKKPGDRPGSAAEVYRLLVPHLGTLSPLARDIRAGATPQRMYAAVLARTPGAAAAGAPAGAPLAAAVPRQDGPPAVTEAVSLGDLVRARRHADRLVREARYDEAARALGNPLPPAADTFGADHTAVVELRAHLADAQLRAGEYAAATETYGALAETTARRDGPEDPQALAHRFQEANCLALAGDRAEALDLLRGLLADETRWYGRTDERVRDLRRKIFLLEAAATDR